MADDARERPGDWGDERPDGVAGRLDDRAVSEVIGSILVFGLLVSLLAIVQTQAVPNANAEIEVKHSQSVQGDIADLQSAVSRTGTFGGTESVTVETGMTYPSRLVLFNPPAVQGTLASGGAGNVSLENFSAERADTDSYIGTNPNFTTHAVSYRVDYNRYTDQPETRYEYGVVANQYDDATRIESGGGPVSGRFITLTMLRGGLQESQVRPASVTTYPVSAPAQRVTVESPDDRPANLTIATGLSDEVWVSKILRDQLDTNATAGTNVTDCGSLNGGSTNAVADPVEDDGRFVVGCSYRTVANGSNELTIRFEQNQSYRLGMSKVAFSAAAEPTDATYVTDVSPSANELVVEVRDRFNNPVERRVDLTVERADGSTEEITTDPRGRAQIQDAVDPQLDRPANVSLRGSSPSDCIANVTCAVVEPPGLPAASNIRVTNVSADDSENTVTFTFENQGSRDTNMSEVQLGFATQRNERTLTVTVGDTLESCGEITDPTTCSLDQEDVTTSFVTDGPDAISNFTVDGTTYSSGIGAVENRDPVAFTDGSGNLATLPRSSTADVTYALDDSFTLAGKDSVDLSVTVYYEDGSVATYSRTLFQEDGGSG
jgi:hypothetical protein